MSARSQITPGFRGVGPRPRIVRLAFDASTWAPALFVGVWLRYDLNIWPIHARSLVTWVMLAMGIQIVTGLASGLYLGRFRFGSFDEAAAVAGSVGATTLVLFFVDFTLSKRTMPLSSTLIGGATSLLLIGGSRYGYRFLTERLQRPSGDDRSRLLVFGAGEAGYQVLSSMLRDPDSPYVPVALLDDDRAKRNLRMMGVRVEGSRRDLVQVAQRRNADTLLIAIPSATSELITELTDIAIEAGLRVNVLPQVSELLGSGVNLRDIRPVTQADLLGRHAVDTDLNSIANYLTGKRVLVTGAGGSIGSELCRQIHRFAPASLVMLDSDETGLLNVRLSIDGSGALDEEELVLTTIHDASSLRAAFETHRPQVVFHAAALKHVPLLERHPGEAVRTNVRGTLNLLEVAHATSVERFVNISTDKAADPCNVLGYSKRICERLTAHFAKRGEGTYLSVRFGNVLGSRGSVLETFRAQIENNNFVTVTHPDVTRFLMTIEEAVQLVIQAGAIGSSGEVLILDMGKPVKIIDIAKRLIAEADRTVRIKFIGLRPGEKLHETLFGLGETDCRPVHEMISHIQAPPLDPAELLALDPLMRPEDLRARLTALCSAERPGGIWDPGPDQRSAPR